MKKYVYTLCLVMLVTGVSLLGFTTTKALAVNGPLRVSSVNPRYLVDGSGKPVFLAGSNYWNAIQDGGRTNPPPAFDFNAFVNFLTSHGENYTKAHVWEQGSHRSAGSSWYIKPTLYVRTGPGLALDGGAKYDLNQLNQEYFDRLRSRVITYGQNNIYVVVEVFDRFSVHDGNTMTNQWQGHPYNAGNNINSINGDPTGQGHGLDTETLIIPSVAAYQEAYVRKLIDSVGDLDNVIWEVAMEPWGDYSRNGYTPKGFVDHFISYIKSYEAAKQKQHLVLQGVFYPEGSGGNSYLFSSRADVISPNGAGGFDHDCPTLTGNKVVLPDTDHISWQETDGADWAWKCFTRGAAGFAMMDGGYSNYDDQGGGAEFSDAENFRYNLGWIKGYADKMDLLSMTPQGNLSSTGYALAHPASSGAEYLVYSQNSQQFSINLSGSNEVLKLEWFNPANGNKLDGGTVSGGTVRTFTPPFSGANVLYLRDARLSSAPTATSIWTATADPVTPVRTTTNTPATTSSTITIGETNVLKTDDAGNGNLLVSQQVNLSQSATLQSLSFYVATATGHLRLGIYDAKGPSGGPGALKAQTAAFIPTTGWNTQNVITPTQLNPGTYWLAYLPESSGLHFRMDRNGAGRWYSYNYGSMPGSYSTSPTSGAYHWSFYATLSTGAVSTNTPTQIPSATATATLIPVSPTNTFTSTVTNVASPAYTATNTPVNVPPATFTSTPVPTIVDPATATLTYTATALPTDTVTASPVPSVTNTPAWTPTDTVTKTGPVPPSQPQILMPRSMTSKTGTSTGSLDSLGKLDQNGTENDPSKYVIFQPRRIRYLGYLSFSLPQETPTSLISDLSLQVNVKGSALSKQTWSIYDWKKRRWVKLGNMTTLRNNNDWRKLEFHIRVLNQYMSPQNEIRIQLQSNDLRSDVKIDYEVLQVIYGSSQPLSLPSVSTATFTPTTMPSPSVTP